MAALNSRQNEVLDQVDDYFKSLGRDEESYTLTNEQKLVFYSNYLAEDNKFRDIVEFHSIHYIKLANLLCNNQRNYILFMNKFYKKGDEVDLVDSFRKFLKEERDRDSAISAPKVNEIFNSNNYSILKSFLQQLFLEIVPDKSVDMLQTLIDKGLSADQFINMYKENSNTNFLRLLKRLKNSLNQK